MYTWQVAYTAALIEKDPVKLKRRLYELNKAIKQRRSGSNELDTEELRALQRAERAIKILTKTWPETRRDFDEQ